MVREGLCSLLTARYGVKVVGEAADGLEAVEKAIYEVEQAGYSAEKSLDRGPYRESKGR